ncbi:MAG: agmatine deiminase family protein [Thiohalospira sp.]
MPEWAEQDAVLLAWPYPGGDWDPWLEIVTAAYRELAAAIADFEPVIILCRDAALRDRLRDQLADLSGTEDHYRRLIIPYDDTWIRDYGPLSLVDPAGPRLLDLRFNGWGGRHAAERDDAVNAELARARLLDAPMDRDERVLEGGAVETDGAGTLITTRRCLLSPSRNPGLDATAIETWLRRLLGVDRILWLAHGGLEGDDTDGHVDTLVRFADPRTLVHQACDDPEDSHYPELTAMAEELAAWRTADGEPYRLRPLPWPRPRYNERGERLPAGYANFLLVNGGVIMPTYDDPADDVARAVLADCFPGREVVGVDARVLLQQGGSVHCATMPLARGVLPD